MRRWEAAYEEGLLTLEAFRLKIAALAKEADALFPDPPPSFAKAAFPPYSQLTNWPLLWSHASDEERRMLMTALVKRVEAAEAPGRNAHGRTIQLQQLVFL
ncbi:hypothetical protein EN829_043755 [Mesorhizobium sp. M00.F.Ca.ET.186.01.1.1]|nr:hypothetical protein EN829_043755 [Mesorhizobium sp. M00.F.Ca.ET.186.01.1.1]